MLAPKAKYRKVRLRGPDGEMLSTEEESRLLQHHCESIFCKDAPATQTTASYTPADLHITREELAIHIQQTPVLKAAPQNRAPAIAWVMSGQVAV